nr:hypothetical protein [Deefgea sp. CFH1-16]
MSDETERTAMIDLAAKNGQSGDAPAKRRKRSRQRKPAALKQSGN